MMITLRNTLLTLMFAAMMATSAFAQSGYAKKHGLTREPGNHVSQEPAKIAAPEREVAREVVPVGADYNPRAVLRAARVLFIRSKSAYLKSSDLENEMRQRAEFAALGLLVTKEEGNADLILEVGRKVPGRKFVYSAIDPRTQIVLTSGSAKADLFGLAPSVAHKIAKRFLQRVQAAR